MINIEQAAVLALYALEDARCTPEHLQDFEKRAIAIKYLREALDYKYGLDTLEKEKYNPSIIN